MITKILSISDVITNSSSEVFVMSTHNAMYYKNLEGTNGCVRVEPIDWDWVIRNEECDAVCDLCHLDVTEVLSPGKWYPDSDEWETFCNKHKKEIKDNIIGLYWVDIEDHFEGAYDVTENARDDSMWGESRH